MTETTLTIREFLTDQANLQFWAPISGRLTHNPSSVLVERADGTKSDVKTLDAPMDDNIVAIGWNGFDSSRCFWLAIDLDVVCGSHTAAPYQDTASALADALKLYFFLGGQVEIRLSKSGVGVHAFWHLPSDLELSPDDGKDLLKGIVKELDLKADKSALGRQCFCQWTRKPAHGAFRLLMPKRGDGWHD